MHLFNGEKIIFKETAIQSENEYEKQDHFRKEKLY